jgi:hypothetical protein
LPKRKTRKLKRELRSAPPPPPSKWKRLVGGLILGGIFLAIPTGIATLVEFWLSSLPRFTYQQSVPLDVAHPLDIRFIFANGGYASAHAVKSACQIHIGILIPPLTKEHPGATLINHIEQGVFTDAADETAPAEPLSVDCRDDVPAQLAKATADVTLRYRPSFVFWSSRQQFRFVLHFRPDGTWEWIPESMRAAAN